MGRGQGAVRTLKCCQWLPGESVQGCGCEASNRSVFAWKGGGPVLHFSEMPHMSLLHSLGCSSPLSKSHRTARKDKGSKEIKTLLWLYHDPPPPQENTISLCSIFS